MNSIGFLKFLFHSTKNHVIFFSSSFEEFPLTGALKNKSIRCQHRNFAHRIVLFVEYMAGRYSEANCFRNLLW